MPIFKPPVFINLLFFSDVDGVAEAGETVPVPEAAVEGYVGQGIAVRYGKGQRGDFEALLSPVAVEPDKVEPIDISAPGAEMVRVIQGGKVVAVTKDEAERLTGIGLAIRYSEGRYDAIRAAAALVPTPPVDMPAIDIGTEAVKRYRMVLLVGHTEHGEPGDVVVLDDHAARALEDKGWARRYRRSEGRNRQFLAAEGVLPGAAPAIEEVPAIEETEEVPAIEEVPAPEEPSKKTSKK